MTTQDNNEAASAPDLHSAIMNLPCKVPTAVFVAWTRAEQEAYAEGHKDARHAAAELAAASASQSSTAGAAKGGLDEVVSINTAEFRERLRGLGAAVSPSSIYYKALVAYVNRYFLAHVARQRQESIPELHNIAEVTRPSDQTLHLRFMSCRSASAFHHFITDKAVFAESTPSAAVAEGVDTAELNRLAEKLIYHVQREQVTAGRKVWLDILAYITTYGAQQREAGRREVDVRSIKEQSDAWFAVCEVLSEVRPDWRQTEGRNGMESAVNTIRALARQPVSEGLTGEQREPTFDRRWSLARDGFGLQRNDESGEYVAHDDAIAVLHAALSAVPPAKAEGMSEEQRQAIRDAIGILSASTDRPIVAVLDSILAQQVKGETK